MHSSFSSLALVPLFVFSGSVAWASLPSQAALSPEIEQAISDEEQSASAQLDAVEQDALASDQMAEPTSNIADDEEEQVATLNPWLPQKKKSNRCRSVVGVASWYGPGFQGHRTASGERFNTGSLTAAHRTLPFNSQVRVTNMNNGRTVLVRINDRGPFVGGRVIDLSKAAARQIGMGGTSRVKLETCL